MTFWRTLLFLLISFNLIGNNEYPYYELGGTSDLKLFFQKDSSICNTIKLEKKETVIELYAGYAVVKNVYHFKNTQDSSFNIFLGFPQSISQPSSTFGILRIDSSLAVECNVNGKIISNNKCEAASPTNGQHTNWYTWEIPFNAKEYAHVQIIQLVYTKSFLKKKNSEYKDFSLATLTQTSKKWKGSISENRVLVKLKDNIKLKDIVGILPRTFKTDGKKLLAWNAIQFEPSDTGNVIIRYQGKVNLDSLKYLLDKKEALFNEIKLVSPWETGDSQWKEIGVEDFGEIELPEKETIPFFWIVSIGLLCSAGIIIVFYKKRNIV